MWGAVEGDLEAGGGLLRGLSSLHLLRSPCPAEAKNRIVEQGGVRTWP